MVPDGLLITLNDFLFNDLVDHCPILSGNMRAHIDNIQTAPDEYEIQIKAPRYDVTKWDESGQLVYTGGPDYALEVELFGGFGTMNKSMHWVRKSIRRSVGIVGGSVGAIIIFQGRMFI